MNRWTTSFGIILAVAGCWSADAAKEATVPRNSSAKPREGEAARRSIAVAQETTKAGEAPRARKWTSKLGKFSVNAEFIKVEAGKVHLKRADTGRIIEVPLDRLSEEDRQFVSQVESPVESSTERPPALWRIVHCDNNGFVPDKDGGAILVLGSSLPLMVTIELVGTYPGLTNLNIREDFEFWDTVNDRAIEPYQIVMPKEIPKDAVGNAGKSVQVTVWLATVFDNGFSRMFQSGYKVDSVAISHKEGPRIPLAQLKPNNSKEQRAQNSSD
jgi:hypothetical protein